MFGRRTYVGRDFFHVSTAELDGKILHPRVPQNYMADNGFENNKIPRVSFGPSIRQCLLALPVKQTGMRLFVYKPAKDVLFMRPGKRNVPDAEITEEIWVIESVKMKKVGVIELIGPEDDGHDYKYGKLFDKRRATLYGYKYKYLEKY